MPGDGDAIELAGHVNVGQQQIELAIGFQCHHCLRPIARFRHRKTLLEEGLAEQQADQELVLDEQDMGFRQEW